MLTWLSLLCLVLSSCTGEETSRPPNIVFILADDLGYADLGSYGSTSIHTPHLDALARRGMRFTQFYTSGATCTPTRAAILTGRWPQRFGLRRMPYPDSARGIPEGVTTLPALLGAQGYETIHVGKWHVGAIAPETLPRAKGFDRFFGFLNMQELGAGRYIAPQLREDEAPPTRREGHLTDLLVERSVDFIREEHARPFFLSLCLFAPHMPIQPAYRWRSRYPNTSAGNYAALVSQLDEGVGRIVAALDEREMLADTVVVFTSDNGGDRNTHASNGTLRGFKAQFFEGGIRVPLLVRWNGRIAPGSRNDAVVLASDLFPMLAEIAGANPAELETDATSFLSLLLGRSDVREPHSGKVLFWERTEEEFAIRRDAWKLVGDAGESYLFDLATDPGEQRNLAASQPGITAELLEAYRAWRASVGRIDVAVARSTGSVSTASGVTTFGPAGGQLALAADPRLDPKDADYTVSLWVEPSAEAVARGAHLVGKGDAWRLALEPGGHPRFEARGANEVSLVLRSDEALVSGRWTHLAVVLDHGTRRKHPRAALHVDGRESASAPGLRPIVTPEPVIVGSGPDPYAPLGGRLSDLRFFNLPLVAEEIATLAAAGPN
jgi:arylsulfatase A-like enzyme